MIVEELRRTTAAMDLFETLRNATRREHRALEQEMGLLRSPLCRERTVRALSRFLGFHREWEPGVERSAILRPLFAGRQRIHRLESDLAALGVEAMDIEKLPRCDAARELVRDEHATMGSLYVMEGSTLGGAVIGQAFAGMPWIPQEGLRYYDSSPETLRSNWQSLRDWANLTWPSSSWPAIEAGALDTFAALRRWFRETP